MYFCAINQYVVIFFRYSHERFSTHPRCGFEVVLFQGVKQKRCSHVIDLTHIVDFHSVCVCYVQPDCPLLHWCWHLWDGVGGGLLLTGAHQSVMRRAAEAGQAQPDIAIQWRLLVLRGAENNLRPALTPPHSQVSRAADYFWLIISHQILVQLPGSLVHRRECERRITYPTCTVANAGIGNYIGKYIGNFKQCCLFNLPPPLFV